MPQKKEPVRLIASDVDGTLLNSAGSVTPRTRAAIQAAQDAGIVFAVCTGRFFENASILATDLQLQGPIISVNGGKISMKPYGETVTAHLMDRDAAKRVFDMLESLQAYYYVFADGLVVVRRLKERHHSQRDYGRRMGKEAATYYRYGKRATLEAIEAGIYKYYVYAPVGGAEELAFIQSKLQGLEGVSLTQSSPQNLEVMPPQVDKEHGVRELAQALGIPMSQVMTVGDELNDLGMIRAAGYGIAMGNAIAPVKDVAFAVTGTNDEDGLAQAIERYALSSSAGQG